MKLDYLTPDNTILKELGGRLARLRKQQGLTQNMLAKESGIGVATLRRIEVGDGSQLESWIKILKALRMTASIDALLPEKFDSPMAEALNDASKGKRRGSGGKRWGDEGQ